MWSLIPILISKIGDFQLPPKSDSLFIQLMLIGTFFSGVSCGGHHAPSCYECPQGHGESWCNGDCNWINNQCVTVGAESI